MKKKEYKVIKYENKDTKYIIFKDGTVVNNNNGHTMKQTLSINGYYIVRLSFKKYERSEVFVHKLLATYFIENPEHKEFVHHIDKNRLNNDLSNLMWVTADEHKKLHENDKHPYGRNENHLNAKLTNSQVHEICQHLQDNDMTILQLAKAYDVNRCVISEIKIGNNWTDISKNYDFSKFNKYDWKANDEDTVRKICREIVSNKDEVYILDKYNIRQEVLHRIYRKKSFCNIVKEYDFSTNDKIKFKHELSCDEKKLLNECLENNLSAKEIFKIMNPDEIIISMNKILKMKEKYQYENDVQ